MKPESVTLAYFSPTGTTKSVLQGIAKGLGITNWKQVDLTKSKTRHQTLQTSENELLLIGLPVYMGRIPALVHDWLNALQARNTPTVCVVVYGNRAYEDALRELVDSVKQRGGAPIAGAAFIGEHSFSTAALPTAQGRPDEQDLHLARTFGQEILQKLTSCASLSDMPALQVPGNYPYGGSNKLWHVDFIEVNDQCIQCGVCADVCPVDAIDAADYTQTDKEKCITCCACIKSCPQNARTIKPSPVHDATLRLHTKCQEPKTPEYFL